MTLSDGFPPFYAARSTSVYGETDQYYLTYAALAILVAVILILPGVRGKERFYFVIRWTASLFVGTSIIACIQGVSWHVAYVDAIVPYSIYSNAMERLEIGLHIGLETFNITVQGLDDPSASNSLKLSEEYHFLQADEELDRALKSGLPYPIINILENFSVNRVSSIWMWGRRYWLAGHYAKYMLMAAFLSWILANLLFHTVLRYGGLLSAVTGFLMIMANLAFFSVYQYGTVLTIQLGYHEKAVLRPSYGWCFWLCLSLGIISTLSGIFIMFADRMCSNALRRFYGRKDKTDKLELLEIEIDSHSSNSRRSSADEINEEPKTNEYQSSSSEDEGKSHAKKLSRSREQSGPMKFKATKEEPQELTIQALVNEHPLAEKSGSPEHAPVVRKMNSVVSFSEPFTASDATAHEASPTHDVNNV